MTQPEILIEKQLNAQFAEHKWREKGEKETMKLLICGPDGRCKGSVRYAETSVNDLIFGLQ